MLIKNLFHTACVLLFTCLFLPAAFAQKVDVMDENAKDVFTFLQQVQELKPFGAHDVEVIVKVLKTLPEKGDKPKENYVGINNQQYFLKQNPLQALISAEIREGADRVAGTDVILFTIDIFNPSDSDWVIHQLGELIVVNSGMMENFMLLSNSPKTNMKVREEDIAPEVFNKTPSEHPILDEDFLVVPAKSRFAVQAQMPLTKLREGAGENPTVIYYVSNFYLVSTIPPSVEEKVATREQEPGMIKPKYTSYYVPLDSNRLELRCEGGKQGKGRCAIRPVL